MARGKKETRKPVANAQATGKSAEELKVAVIGFGTMGRQIAQVFAQNGHEVTATDTIPDAMKAGMSEIENGPYGLKSAVSRGKITLDQARDARARIRVTDNMEDACKDAELIVEAAIEEPKLKQEIFQRLDETTLPEAILATNTSTLSITKISSTSTRHQERIVGMHFFNPAQITRLVEIVKGEKTSSETVDSAMKIVRAIGKTPVLTRDEPGFIANRLGLTLYMEASRMVEDGVANILDIDNAMRLGYGHPMGPFETADLVGLDTRIRNLASLYKSTGDTKWLPPKILQEMVNQGYLGDPSKKKGSKGGYYQYYHIQREERLTQQNVQR